MAIKNDTRTLNDAELLERTAQALREERRARAHEDRLEQYAAGKLDAAAVREAAHADGTDGDIDAELEAFAPLDGGARAQVAARALEDLREGRGAPRDRGFRFRRVTMITGALAAAAALLFVLHAPPGASPLPAYALSFVGGEQSWRGEEPAVLDGTHRFARGEHIRLFARPQTAVSGPVEARLFLRRGDDVRAWPTQVEVSSAGAVRVVAAPETLPPGTEGAWDVVMAVGRPSALPGPTQLDAASAARMGFQLVITRVEIAR